MSTDWYFVRDGARVGPHPREEVESLLASGELPPATLVWTAGMENWRPASETPELGGLLPADGPPPPPLVQAAPSADTGAGAYWSQTRPDAYDAPAQPLQAESTRPHPGRRLIAWLVDLFCFAFILGPALAILAPNAMTQANPVAMNVLLFALLVPLQALALGGLGSTPGKRLMRIRVTHADGSRLGFGTAMERSVQVWLRGLGLGLPFVSIATMLMSYFRLSSRGRTSWDERLDLRVTHGEMSAPRWAGVALLLAVVVGMMILGSMQAGTV